MFFRPIGKHRLVVRECKERPEVCFFLLSRPIFVAVHYRHHQVDDKELRVSEDDCGFLVGFDARGGIAGRYKSHEESYWQGLGEGERILHNLKIERCLFTNSPFFILQRGRVAAPRHRSNCFGQNFPNRMCLHFLHLEKKPHGLRKK